MSTETKSNPEAKPSQNGNPVATAYVQEELEKGRKSLKRAKLTTIILLAVVGGYMGFITVYFTGFMEPKNVAQVATSIISERVDQHANEITDRIKTEVPKLVADLPDMVIKKLPEWREELEVKVEDVMQEKLAEHSVEFGKHLDDFLALHRAEIAELLNATGDKEKTKVLMTSIEQDILEFLGEEMEDGESIKEKLDFALDTLKGVETQMNRLANAKDLTPQEKKARRAIALISKKVENNRPAAN